MNKKSKKRLTVLVQYLQSLKNPPTVWGRIILSVNGSILNANNIEHIFKKSVVRWFSEFDFTDLLFKFKHAMHFPRSQEGK